MKVSLITSMSAEEHFLSANDFIASKIGLQPYKVKGHDKNTSLYIIFDYNNTHTQKVNNEEKENVTKM